MDPVYLKLGATFSDQVAAFRAEDKYLHNHCRKNVKYDWLREDLYGGIVFV